MLEKAVHGSNDNYRNANDISLPSSPAKKLKRPNNDDIFFLPSTSQLDLYETL